MVVHWLSGVRLVYTSAKKPWTVSTIASPPFWRVSAVIALSSPGAFLVFVCLMIENVSSRVGGLVMISCSWSAGGGSADGDWLLQLLSREPKYSLPSANRSVSLVGGVPFVLLSSTLVFLPLPGSSWMIFHVVVFFALGACNLEAFHLFVQHGYFVWFVGLIKIGIKPPPTFSLLLWLGDQVLSLGFIFLHLQLQRLVCHPTWQTTWLTFDNDFLSCFCDNMLKLLVSLGYWCRCIIALESLNTIGQFQLELFSYGSDL